MWNIVMKMIHTYMLRMYCIYIKIASNKKFSMENKVTFPTIMTKISNIRIFRSKVESTE